MTAMVRTQYSLSWDSFNSSICRGLSSLQQNGEFVDMTLAADGHYVKVHQLIMALASPYLKDLIIAGKCQHPVIFLNNISYKTLTFLLIYIYTGEVHLPAENLHEFAEAGKALHIKGLENVSADVTQMESGEVCHLTGIKRMAVPESEGMEQIALPAAARKICVKSNINSKAQSNSPESVALMKNASGPDNMENTEMAHDSDIMDVTQDSDDDCSDGPQQSSKTIAHYDGTDIKSNTLQFTVSIRGCLQIILNRYMYNFHCSKQHSVRRWRCVDYRNKKKCTAFVVTKGNMVLNRANFHNHPFHDKKILAKVVSKSIYSAIEDVAGYSEEGSKVKLRTTLPATTNSDDQERALSLPQFDLN